MLHKYFFSYLIFCNINRQTLFIRKQYQIKISRFLPKNSLNFSSKFFKENVYRGRFLTKISCKKTKMNTLNIKVFRYVILLTFIFRLQSKEPNKFLFYTLILFKIIMSFFLYGWNIVYSISLKFFNKQNIYFNLFFVIIYYLAISLKNDFFIKCYSKIYSI